MLHRAIRVQVGVVRFILIRENLVLQEKFELFLAGLLCLNALHLLTAVYTTFAMLYSPSSRAECSTERDLNRAQICSMALELQYDGWEHLAYKQELGLTWLRACATAGTGSVNLRRRPHALRLRIGYLLDYGFYQSSIQDRFAWGKGPGNCSIPRWSGCLWYLRK